MTTRRGRFLLLLLVPLLAAVHAGALPGNGEKDEQDKIEQRQQWFYGRRALPDGSFPLRARELGIQKALSLPVTRWMAPSPWRVQSGGVVSQQITTSWTFPVSGAIQDGCGYGFGAASPRINAIAVHPTNPNLLYIASSFGGVAKSADGGNTWTYLTDGLPSLEITSLAIDTTSPNIIYAGTGDPYYAGHGTSLLGVGVYRSVNSGSTWTQFGAATLGGAAVGKIVIDPATSGSQTNTTIYAAVFLPYTTVANAVFKSVDSGQTWSAVKTGDSAYDLAVDTTNPSTLYAATYNGIYKSVNSGGTWTFIHDNPDFKTKLAMSGSTLFVSLGTGSFTSATAPNYSYTSNGSPTVNGEVFKTTDGGTTWTQLTAANGFCATQCRYDQSIAVDPANSNNIFLGGVDASRSTNGGASFTNYAPFNPPSMTVHSDHHALAFAPSNTAVIYEGNDGGLYGSTNGGASWLNLNAGITGALVIGVSVSGDGHMAMGAQDNASNQYAGGSAKWSCFSGGDGGFAKIDAGNSQIMYGTYVESPSVAAGTMFRSANGGASTTDITPSGAVGAAESSQFYPTFYMKPEDSTFLLAGFQNVWESVNSGTSWTRIGNLAGQDGGTITALTAAPSNNNVLYAATSNKKVYVTNNANLGTSATWALANTGLPAGQTMTAFAVHPQSTGTVYLTLSQYGTVSTPDHHVYKTVNSGGGWSLAESGLPDVPFNDIAIDTASPNNLFAASDVGVFNSIDGGSTWTNSSVGMPTGIIVNALWLNTGTRQLVAGTYGRGVYSLTLPPVPSAPTGLAASVQGVSSISWTWSAAAPNLNVQAYGVYYATNPSVLLTSVTTPSYTWTGLTANTTYSLQVTQANGILESANSLAVSAVTLASAPVTPALSAVNLSSIAFNWSPNGDPAGTLFIAQISTDNFATLNASSATLNVSAAFLNLLSNNTYYLRVQAINYAGVATAFAALPATATPAALPSAGGLAGVGTGAATASWGSGGNGPSTVYQAQFSTDNFATVNFTSATMNLSAVFGVGGAGALAPNTTLYFQVRVAGFSANTAFVSLGSTVTLANPPVASAPTVYQSSIAFNWNANGDPVGTYFTAQISTDNFNTLNSSSQTLNSSATFFNLLSNTSYFLQAQAINYGGMPTGFSSVSTATAVALPVSAQPTGVAVNSVTALWGAGGNGPNTLYLAQISTDSFATVNASSQTYNSSVTFSGLQAATAYSFRVQAIGFSGQQTAFVTLPSTTTPGLPPAAAAVPFGTVDASSLTTQWMSGGNGPATTYTAQISTDNFATVNFASSTLNLSVLFGAGGAGAALNPDTTYYLRVQTNFGLNSSAFLNIGSTATLAVTPAATSPTVYASSLSFNWSRNGDSVGTLFTAQISSDNFATVNASSQTLSASATFFGLVSNATYYLRVQAVNFNALPTAFTAALAAATLPAPPSAGAVSVLGTNALSSSWGAAGNSAATVYAAQISTDNFATLNIASATLSASVVFGAGGAGPPLNPNTTYFLRVQAQGFSGQTTAFVPLGSTATFAAVPVAAVPSLYPTSAALAWSAAGNPARTLYAAQISTDNFATLNASSATLNASATFFSLLSNASYYLRVQALNYGGIASAFAVSGATATPVVAPAVGQPSGLSFAAVTANWGAATDGAATLFLAQVSTDNFATVNASSLTYNSSATFSGLAADTTYYFQVAAQGFSALTPFVTLPSTMTPLLPPAAAASAFPSVGFTSATVQWSGGGNGPTTVYQAQLSTDNFATVNLSSLTANLSALFGSGGAGPPLIANTTYYLRVRSTRGGNASAFIVLGSTATSAFAPTGTAIVGVSSTAIGLSWSGTGNPAATVYEIWRDVSNAFPAPARASVAALSYTATGLAASTTYYFQVHAAGNSGAYSAFDAVVATATLPAPPGLPGAPAAAVLGVSSISWTWAAAPAASTYTLVQASNPATIVAVVVAPPAVVTGLAVNTAYGVAARGFNVSGPGPLGPPATAYTFAMAPTGTAFSQVQTTSATISWSLNGNPAATTASVERSTDNVSFVQIASPQAVTYIDYSLLSCTTYYYRVRNFNGDSVATSYDAAVNFETLVSTPLPPGGLSALPQNGNRILLSWSPSPSPQIAAYHLYTDSGTGPVNHLTAVLPSTATSFTTGVLASSAAYTFLLRAFNACGVEEPNSSVLAAAASTAAVSAVSASISAPASGQKIGGNSVTVSASLFSGTASSVSQILFQFRPSGTQSWSSVPAADAQHPNPALSPPYLSHWDVTGLGGSYDVRAVATNLNGQADGAPPAATITVDNANADVTETNLGAGVIQRTQKIYNAASNTIAASAGASALTVNVIIPAGALASGTATVTVEIGPTGLPAVPAGYVTLGMSLQVGLSGGQSLLSGGQTAPVVFNYIDDNGFIAGTTVRADLAKIFVYNPASGNWEEQFGTTLDSVNHTLTGSTPHFSLFQVLAVSGADLNAVRVYPNPFEPNRGDSNRGKPFNSGDPASGIIFDTLPVGAAIDIYTVTGRRIAHLSGGTTIQWNARTDGGRDAASGGYLAVITSPGLPTVVKKILIVR